MSLIFRLFLDCWRSVRWLSARATAASRLIGSGAVDGRSTGFSDEVQSGSSVPLTINRLSDSSDVLTVACDCTSVLRRDAASAWADTTSIGASVPISTRDWLSWIRRLARSNEFCAASTA